MAVSAIVSAVASSVATSVAWSVAANYAISTFTFAVIETAVGLAVGGLLNAAFAGSESASSVPNFTAEARDRTQVVRSSVANRFVVYGETIMSGPLVYAESTGDSNEYIHLVIPLANHEVESIGTVYINDEQITSEMLNVDGDVTSGKYENYVVIRKHLGAADQAADAQLVSLSGTWTANHRLQGVAYIYVRLLYSQDVFPFGLPNIKAVVKGKKLYDPRTGTTAWSDNFALCVYDYLVNEYGLSAGTDEIDSTTFQAAANVADENVTINLGGDTQKRYTCNGAIDLGNRPIDVLTELCTSGAAALVYTQGVYKLYAGDATTSTASLDESYLRGPVSVRTRKARKELFNSVRGTYLSATNFWQPTDFPEVTNSTYVTQDGSEKIYRDIQLPFTDDSLAAQRIAKIHLERSRQGITVEMPCNLKALELSPYDVVSLSIDRFGWTSKEFRIVNWQISPDGGVDLTLQEEDSTAYDWNYGEATVVDAAPDTNLPDPFTVSAPTALTVTESLYQPTNAIGYRAQAEFSWSAADAFSSEYFVDYKLSTDSEYTPFGTVRSTHCTIRDLQTGTYTFRVKAINSFGVSSSYATKTQSIAGATAPPSDVANFSVVVVDGTAYLQWSQSTDPDVIHGGGVRLRHTSATSGATWDGSTQVSQQLPGTATNIGVPARSGTYLAKFVDALGNFSANAALAVTTTPGILSTNVATTVTEDSAFSGSKTQTVVDTGLLQLDFDGSGDVYSSGIYEFANDVDLGGVFTCRLLAISDGIAFSVNDTIDSRGSNFDSWATFDAVSNSNLANVTVEFRYTEDDPAGTPTWSDWLPLYLADVKARGFEFRASFVSQDADINIRLETLRVQIDMPDRVERGYSASIDAGGTTINYSNAFYATPAVGITAQNVASGDYWNITAQDETGFTIQFKNSSDTGVARTINWVAAGYGKQL